MLQIAQSYGNESRYLQLQAVSERASLCLASFEQEASEYDSMIIRMRLAREAEIRQKKRRFKL